MSLVSDALKKVQRTRAADMPAGAHVVGRRGPLLSTQHIIWILVGFAVIAAVGVGITVMVVRNSAAELAAAKSQQAPRAANPNTPAVSPPAIPAPAAPASAEPTAGKPAIPSSVAPRVAETALPSPRANTPAAAATAPAGAAKTPPMAAVPAAAMKPELRIQIFIDDAKITAKAIRSDAPAENKVQMNDRVYRINDIVDRSLNLRITEIFDDHLTFVDENGVTYTKRF